jgi:diacylglycerol kinase (ATP)
MSDPFCIKKRVLSFKYAIQGIFTLIKTQHNMWIHLLATIFVVSAGFYFHVQTTEWLFLIIAIL